MLIKICGLKNISSLKCCIDNNINFFGLIFYKKSPRNIDYEGAIKLVNFSKNKKISSVGVFVNKQIDKMNEVLKKINFDYIQLHGHENNDYIKYIKKNNIKIIKVLSINNKNDLKNISQFKDADMYLFDYKPKKSELPGGNAKKFDWELLKDLEINKNWFLSGGINRYNINDIKKYTIPYGIDISSGVEVKPGIKSNIKIISLMNAYEK